MMEQVLVPYSSLQQLIQNISLVLRFSAFALTEFCAESYMTFLVVFVKEYVMFVCKVR